MKADQDKALRPGDWDSYIGQEKVKERLKIQIDAAKSRNQPLAHILLTGEPGTGKTSLSSIIADEMGMDFEAMMITPGLKMTSVTKRIMDRDDGMVLLTDEIHNMSKANQHYMYSILEDNEIAMDSGDTVPIEIPLTIIGATTDPGMLSKAMHDRFDIKHRLETYTDEEMTEVVLGMAERLELKINRGAAIRLGQASAGTPRQARILTNAGRDIGVNNVDAILKMTGISQEGLTEDHIDYLQSLSDLGGQSGIQNLVNHTGRPREIIIDIEKLLVRRKFVELGRSGRTLMVPGLKALRRINKEKGNK